ncbi:hypothetical protein GCM10023189_12530 [Nibrella saemangeumensis]|uniref:Gliding motility-associated C-terminal domain-containing protein n=1 Tax=Nibrella saemangeumensis TaxID=1084526 RepID=A0ABP8MKT3_9BACT
MLNNDTDRTGAAADLTNVTLPTIITQPTGGVVTVNADGTITYNANDTFTGNDQFVYRICDVVNTSLCDTAIVRINVGNAPAPQPVTDQVTGSFGQPVTVSVLGNDLAGNGQPASLTNVTAPVIVDQPNNGTAVINPDGTITYTPAFGFAGSDTLTYQICSTISPNVCATAQVVFSVPSAPPTANLDVASIGFQQSVTVPVLLNDTDRAGRPANLSTVTAPIILDQPNNGTAVVNSTGTITYTPNAGFAGSDTLIYRICDVVNPLLCDSALVVFNVGSVAPVADRDNYTTAFNTPVQIPVLLNDEARGGLPASLTNVTAPVLVSQPTSGNVVVNADGTFTYTPNTGFAGADQFIYRICDVVNQSLCDTALVVVNVGSQAPRANADVATVVFNQPTTVNVLANDADRTGNIPATLATVSAPVILAQPDNGTAVVNADGSISFSPAPGFAGTTTLVYQICDRVNTSLCDTARVTFNVGSAPPVANPDSYTLGFNQTLALTVLANDTDRTGAPADLTNVTLPTIITQPTGGTVTVNADGTITYNANNTFTGNDQFIYRICDVVNTSLCDTAIVRLNVGNAPAPAPVNDQVTGGFGQTVTVSLLNNDLAGNGQPASLTNVTAPTIVDQPNNGTAVINPDGSVSYTPAPGFAGSDTLTYQICSTISPNVCATAQIIFNVQSAPPTANLDVATIGFQQEVTVPILLNDTDRAGRPANLSTVTAPIILDQPDNGTARVNSTGSITYTPNAGFAGSDTLIYRICDVVNPLLCDSALVVFNVGSVAPVADRDNYTTAFNTPVQIPVLLNDDARGGLPASLTNVTAPVLVSQPTSGNVVVNADGTFTYTPNTGFAGADQFIYRICDVVNQSLCDTALVVVNVGSQAPRANADVATVVFNQPTTVNVLANDADRTGNIPATLATVSAPVILAQPDNGTAVVNADGSISFSPAPGFAGTTTLVYQICDRVNTSLCDTARVTFNVGSAPPVANPDSYTLGFNQTLALTVLANDTDRTGATADLTNVTLPTIVTQPTGGVVTVNADGTITYNANDTFTGNDQFIYRICDVVNTSLCDTAVVRINVGNAPAPTAQQDVVVGSFGQTVTVSLLGNDLAGNGQPANLTNVTTPVLVSGPANGTATINPDGTLTFTPALGFAGNDTLVYQICSVISPNVCDTARIIINVPSAPPTANLDVATTAFQQEVTVPILLNDTDRAGRPANLSTVTAPIILDQPNNGTARVNSTGSITYTPNAGFAGSDTLIYRICDVVNTLLCDSALVVVNVGSTVPVANRDNYTTAFNAPVQIPVLLNDQARGGSPASLTSVTLPVIVSQPSDGAVTVNPDGTITYSPFNAFAGADQFVYRICDQVNQSLCDTALVVVNVGSAAPVANPDLVTATFNTALSINVLANDADRSGNIPASLTSVTAPVILSQPDNGTAVVNADGTISFTPATGFAGFDTLVYQICDRVNTSLCDTARVVINVGSAPPVANPDSYTLGFNQTLALTVLDNDVNRNGVAANLTGPPAANVTLPVIFAQPANGTVVVNADGTITYNPNDTFTGNDAFIYRICDVVNTSLCDTALVRINIGNAPAPQPANDQVSGGFGQTVTVSILNNDLAGNGQSASLTNVTAPVIVDQPNNGTAVINPDGSVSYTPAPGFAGSDTLTYQICSIISPNVCATAQIVFNVQSAPPTANLDVATIGFQQEVTVPVLLNDTDRAGNPASLSTVTTPIILDQPDNGTARVNSTGSITYTPNAGFAGSDTLIYRICDVVNPLLCDSALVVFNVGSVAPVADRDNYTTAFNTPVQIPVLLNDEARGGLPASLTNVTAPVLVSQPTSGNVVVNVDGTITYTPNTGFAGADQFVYRICDAVNQALCDTALVVVNVGSAAPRANSDLVTTFFDTPLNINVLDNDADRNGTIPATLTNVSAPVILDQPDNGTALVNANGSIAFTPAPGFAGNDTLVYQICDRVNTSLCDTARVVIRVQSAPPVANADQYTLGFNQTLALTVLTNDTDRTGAPASLTSVTLPLVISGPNNGQVTINPDGSITYNPNDTFTGNDQFVYSLCDIVDPTRCDTAIVRINVGNAPAPTAQQDVVVGSFGQSTSIDLLGNDLAGNGQPANLTNVTTPVLVSGPNNGAATINPDGTITFTPALGFAGSDTLVYQICSVISPSVCDTARIIINVPSAPPTANLDVATTAFQQEVTVPILLNDTDRAGRPANLSTVTAPIILDQPNNGTARVNSTGSITYTPNAGFAGSDTLIYRICDVVNTLLCDSALVVINVGSVAPVANRDNYTTALNTPVQIPVLLNDDALGGQPASLTNVTAPVVVNQPSNGTLTLNANGSITYTPNFGFAGADSFIYRICDQVNQTLCDTALVVVNVGSAAPRATADVASVGFNQPATVNVLANDADRNGTVPATLATVSAPVILDEPNNGTVVVNANGSITFTPAPGFAGSDTLVYQICDRVNTSLCDTARVVFNVQSAPPVANPDQYTLGFNQTLALTVLTNDTDRTGAPASLTSVTLPTIVTQPTGGGMTVNADGTITYNANDTFTGNDQFVYRICDVVNTSLCDTAVVRINVGNAPAPNPVQDVVTGVFGQPLTVSVLTNDLAGNGQPANLTNVTAPVIVDQPNNGTAVVNADGTITFTPAPGFAGSDTLTYQICSIISPNICATAQIVFNVQSAPPVANRDFATTAFQQEVTVPILLNDTDKAGQPATLSTVTAPIILDQPNNGTARVNSTGSITYTPNAGFAGSDTLIYRICDVVNTLLCDSALVVISVSSTAPIANRDNYTTAFNQPITVPILLNDTGRGGAPASLTSVTAPVIVDQFNNGTGVINANGTLTYTPNTGFAGSDTLVYRICDQVNQALCDTALVVIGVGSGAPRANSDIITTAFNTTVTFGILANDQNRSGAPANLTNVTAPVILSQPTNGTALINPDGTFSYRPATGFAGLDTVVYQICDVVNRSLCDTARIIVSVQSAPPVANPDSYTLGFNQTLALNVLANDQNRTGAPASLTGPPAANVTLPTITFPPTNGVVTVNADGTITYNPNDTFTGNDAFIYSICDVVDPTRCDTAIVRINIGNAPAPRATQDVITGALGQPVTINALANDLAGNGQPANLTNVTPPVIVDQPNNGTAVVNADGTITFTPTPGFAGSDTLIYRICSLVSPNVCDTTRIIINVPSAPPTANRDDATTTFQQEVTIPVLLNDTGRAGLPASLTTVTLPIITQQPDNGTAGVNSTGSITYTPNAGFAGSDTLIYRICDQVNTLLCDSALVVINVGSAAPVANRDNYTTALNTPTTVPILLNDLGRGGFPASLTAVTNPVIVDQFNNGTGVINANGTLTYTPNSGFAGADTMIYRICDQINTSLCDTALVVINIGSAAPRANADFASTGFQTAVTIPVLLNDQDRNNQPASTTNVTGPVVIRQPQNGSAVVTVNGSIIYTPDTGFGGNDTLVYQICDRVNTSLCDTARVIISVAQGQVTLVARAYLQGALFGVFLPDTLMRDDLRVRGLLPTTSPYTPANGFTALTVTGTVNPSVFSVTGPNAIVDWVFVELRNPANPTQVVDSRSALIQRDGDIVNLDGVSPVRFNSATAASYYVVVKHRNHLGVMTQTAVPLSTTGTVVDFRRASTPTYTYTNTPLDQAQVVVEQGRALWAGNALRENLPSIPHEFVTYQGTENDVNVIYQQVINAPGNIFGTPFYKLRGYFTGDVNMNGEVIFQGTGNDVEFIYQNVIKNHPGNTLVQPFFRIREQLP